MRTRLAADAVVLGIETSCDDTAAALYSQQAGVIAHSLAGQHASHRGYGGVVPEVASRDHAGALLGLIDRTVGDTKVAAVACTAGPGLAGCLAAGLAQAQALAYAWQVPLAPVNHLEGHLLSPFLEPAAGFDFPYLCLLVTGGHTALVDVTAPGDYAVLGATLDDACGEALDKTGILLGLPFPGGAALEELAAAGDPARHPLPSAMARRGGCDMSFAGLKTAARRLVQQQAAPADVAAAFQAAVLEQLRRKTARALALSGRPRLAVVGGVARNRAVRAGMEELAAAHRASAHFPPARWCTDNAAMIALAGCGRLQQGYGAAIRPRWPLTELEAAA